MVRSVSVKSLSGVTLIELMIVVAIIGILGAVAYPSYLDHILRSNRSEGQRELVRFANLQEQLFVDTRAYTNDMSKLGGSGSTHETEHGYYKIKSALTASGFTLTATAQGSQLKDTGCLTMTISETGAKTPSSGCWE
ncbi:type IV minor pilin protein PilE [Thalassotalea insulae]|uniref:Type IV minor pilin protein PilE n=1 Tax=Thalassotalea insulae TaxID=2056778 RepID=A0ABQ6GMD8_9GAMM|nr:type IV pilin protein [Thalassotalea insulae]GLX77160.1 type IV minor pilin protein PilE [Thalassotalea insulae]